MIIYICDCMSMGLQCMFVERLFVSALVCVKACVNACGIVRLCACRAWIDCVNFVSGKNCFQREKMIVLFWVTYA